MEAVLYSASSYVNRETGFTCRYNYSNIEKFELHYHDYFEVFLTISGDVVHFINGKRQVLKKNSLIFIRPWDIHTYRGKEEPFFSFINLTFTKETIQSLFSYLSDGFPGEHLLTSSMPPFVILTDEDQKRLLSRLDKLNTLGWENSEQQKLTMRALLMDVMVRYFAFFEGEEQRSDIPEWLEQLCQEMNHTSQFSQGAEKMIALGGKSREHLSRCMKKYYGTTVSRFISDLRLNYIANRLISTDAPVLDLCFESGFQNVGWFYTLFKEKFSVSPAEFREKYK